MYTKTKNLIETLTSNIKKNTHIEEIEKINEELTLEYTALGIPQWSQ